MLYRPSAHDGHCSVPPSQSITNNSFRRPISTSRSPLAQLGADEHVIELRKFNVKRFGAGWLRPPGVTKTLQSKLEEAQEQLEQIEMQRRDAELRAQEAAQHAAMGVPGLDVEEVPDQEERDLDADVPEAEQSALASDEDPEYTASVTFNEASLLQGSPGGIRQAALELEDAELDGRLQDVRDLGMEGDLDDDVPEAGSYEHTDTELEDDSSDEDEVRQSLSQTRGSTRSDGRARRSLFSEDNEMLASSSFVESSPALARRAWRGNNAFANSVRDRTRHA
jgi:hypothetical protein